MHKDCVCYRVSLFNGFVLVGKIFVFLRRLAAAAGWKMNVNVNWM